MESLVHLAYRDHLESLESRVPKDLKDTEVLLVCKVCLVPLVLLETKVRQDHLEPTESLEHLVAEDLLALTDLLVLLD